MPDSLFMLTFSFIDMKKFLLRIVIFFVFLLVADIIAGIIFPLLVNKAKGGDNWRNNYICNKANEDILVFGSSRAIHHYNPMIISDSMNMSCYNCGQDGNGIILNYGRLDMISQRYLPKIVIYDIQPSFDLFAGDDNHKYLKWLKAYYEKKGIPEIFESVDKTEKFKMMSNLYRYNSNFVQIVSDCIRPQQTSGQNGFRPLYGEMDRMKISKRKGSEDSVILFDSLKLAYMNKLIDISKDIRLVFVISPTWDGMNSSDYKPIEEICRNKGILFVNFADNPKYMHNYAYFKDGAHLNSVGADEFTKDLMIVLKDKGL